MERDWGREKLGDKTRGLAQGEGGGTVDDMKEAIRTGRKVLLWGPDPRGQVGKVFDTVAGRAELVSVDVHNKGGRGREGAEGVRDPEGRPGWLTVWRLVEGG